MFHAYSLARDVVRSWTNWTNIDSIVTSIDVKKTSFTFFFKFLSIILRF